MKHTQIIELLSNIKATFVSFFSIMMFVALSVAIFSGVSWTGPALQTAANQVFEEGKMHDFEITYPYGMTEENYEELRALDGIDEVEGGYLSFQTAKYEGSHTMKVMSLTETMDVALNVKGDLPVKKGEIAVNSVWASKRGIRIGEQIRFTHDGAKSDQDGMKYLVTDTYTVTAIMDNPAYAAVMKWTYGVSPIGRGTIDCLGWVAPESFDTGQFTGYVQTYIRSDTLRREKSFSKKYDEVAEKLYGHLNDMGEDVSEARFLEIKGEAQAKVDKVAKELDETKEQIKDGKQQIADGEQKLITGRAELAAGWQKLQEGLAKLQDGQRQYDSLKPLYDEAGLMHKVLGEVIRDIKKQDSSGQKQTVTNEVWIAGLEKAGGSEEKFLELLDKTVQLLEQLELEKRQEKYRTFRITITSDIIDVSTLEDFYQHCDKDLADAKQILEKAFSKLQIGWNEYNAGLAEYKRGQQQLAEGEALLAQKKQELEEAIKEYDAGVIKLEEGQKEVDALQQYGWTILSRNGNGGVQAIQRYSSITDNIRYSMAMLFIIIGLLVSYSAISRVVKDQIVSLGTKKALGLRSREITLSYLAYSGTAVFTGAVIGFLLGTFGIEKIIAMKLGERFIMGTYASQFVAWQAALLFVVEIVLILLTTWFACRSILQMQTVELLKGSKPPVGKQRFFEGWKAWERLSLLNKTIVNNCFNDKKRVIGTIIGVAGCTALMVTAITMNDNIQKSFARQYENIYHYDTLVRNTQRDGVQQQVNETLDKLDVSGTPVHIESLSIDLPDGKNSFVKLTVPFDEKNFDSFYSAIPKKKLTYRTYKDGVWLNAAYERHFGAEVGDTVSVTDSSGQRHSFTIEGFFEHHLISYQMIMQTDVYEKIFAQDCEANAFLVDAGKTGTAGVRKALDGVKGIILVKNDYKANENIFLEFSQVTGIVIAIYLVLSVLMAIVVLLDLNIVCVEEKKRELIVLMINGFSIRDARRYIYRDTIVLTAIGIICGIIFGSIMGNIAVMSVEPNETSFIKEIDWMACLIGAASSATLSYVMSKIALRRIAGFSLTDINKM